MIAFRRLWRRNWDVIKILLGAGFMLLVIQLLSFHKKQETIVVRRIEDLKNVGEDVLQSEIHPRRLKALESTTKGNASNPRGVPTNSTATTKEHSIQNQNLPPSISQKEEEIEEESELLNVIALPKFKVKVVSGKTMAEVHVNGQLIYFSGTAVKERGIHVVVLNQASGAFITAQVFDTYLKHGEGALSSYLDNIIPGRVVCVAIKDEGTFHLLETGRKALRKLGSKVVDHIEWRSTFVMIARKGGELFDEEWRKAPDVHSWAADIALSIVIEGSNPVPLCEWTKKPQNKIRSRFCSLYTGYPNLCSCKSTVRIGDEALSLPNNNLVGIPVLVISKNNSQALLNTLDGLRAAVGAKSMRIVVATSGSNKEIEALSSIFRARTISILASTTATASEFYHASVVAAFKQFPSSQYLIVLEENIDVSGDIFNYFSQTLPILKEDSSIYCISAWNYLGYKHTAADPAQIYRVETPPGVAWLTSRHEFESVMSPQWPKIDKDLFSWDSWMGTKGLEKGRECIVPEVSRAVLKTPSQFWDVAALEGKLAGSHALNAHQGVKIKDVDKMNKKEYEILVTALVKSSTPVDHSLLPTDPNFIPFSRGHVFAVYIEVSDYNDLSSWSMLSKLLNLWSTDVRGIHLGLWQFHFRGSQILIIGCPISQYCRYKPGDITPIRLWTAVHKSTDPSDT